MWSSRSVVVLQRMTLGQLQSVSNVLLQDVILVAVSAAQKLIALRPLVRPERLLASFESGSSWGQAEVMVPAAKAESLCSAAPLAALCSHVARGVFRVRLPVLVHRAQYRNYALS